MAKHSGLGRGLDALIPIEDTYGKSSGIEFLPVNKIGANPRQPRTHIMKEELEELAASIREHGILQPLIVSAGKSSGEYILIAGERRLQAAKIAGLETVPAIIREVSEQQRLELALIENLQREDLNPLEAAEAYHQLSDEFNLSHDEISSRVGKSRAAITNTLRLLKLPTSVRQALTNGEISEGHARALLGLPTSQSQTAALQIIINKGFNVRQTEDYVRQLSGQKVPSLPKQSPIPEIAALEEQLRNRLGTKVKLNNRNKGGGTIVIHYYSDEELDTLLHNILGDLG